MVNRKQHYSNLKEHMHMYLRNFKFLLTFTFLLSFSFAQEDFDLGDDEKSSTSENQKFSICSNCSN